MRASGGWGLGWGLVRSLSLRFVGSGRSRVVVLVALFFTIAVRGSDIGAFFAGFPSNVWRAPVIGAPLAAAVVNSGRRGRVAVAGSLCAAGGRALPACTGDTGA